MSTYSFEDRITIVGGGNIGMSIAQGLVDSQMYNKEQITITRKASDLPKEGCSDGFVFTADNVAAVRASKIVIFAVIPILYSDILKEVKTVLRDDQTIISIVTGVAINDIAQIIEKDIRIVRAMPNIAIKIKESMTCLAANEKAQDVLPRIIELFNCVGRTLVIDEEYISSATALASCGIAFFLRSIRAASQGGTQIGFHAEEAQFIAAQTAKGAAELILKLGTHPEDEIDKVTTPRGVTIAGLNEMEHNGFSSAFIKGIVTAYEKSK